MKKNYKSDFDIILTLKTCVRHEDGTCSKRDVGWPEHDWVATFRTENGLREYVASRKGDTFVNCFNDNGRIHVVFNNHRLGKGVLRVDFHSEIPNAIYPDGIQDLYEPQPLDIELVDGPGDCAGAAKVEVLLPYIKGDKGESGRDAGIPVIHHGADDISVDIAPDVLHVWGVVAELTLQLAEEPDDGLLHEYMVEFVSGETPTILSLPASVKWVVEPEMESGRRYQLSIVNGIGVIGVASL